MKSSKNIGVKMKQTALLLVFITVISKIFGFVRDLTLSYFYGTSNVSDAYLISQTIPVAIFSLIGVGISTGYIPMLTKIEVEKSNAFGLKFTSNLVNTLLAITTILVLLVLAYTPFTVKLFASGFDKETLELAIQFTRISVFSMYFTGIAYILSGFLQVRGNYVIPALSGLPLNIISILFIFLSTSLNVYFLVIGNIMALLFQLFLLIPFAAKQGYRYKFNINFKDRYLRGLMINAIPIIFGVSVNQINFLVDRTIASQLVVGGISALEYANKLNGFVQGIFVLTLVTVMYPFISRMVIENNFDGLKKSVREVLNGINILVVPIVVGFMILSIPIITFLFGRGAFGEKAIRLTALALFYYSPGMIGIGIRDVLSRVFYSMQDTKTPMVNAILGMIINIVLNFVLSRFLGIGGLALATSISAIFSAGLMYKSLRKKVGSLELRNIGINLFKILIASFIMGILSIIVYRYLITMEFNLSISLLIAITVATISYLLIVRILKIEGFNLGIESIKKKLYKM